MPQAANRELPSHSSLQVSSRRLPKRTRVNRRRCRVTRVREPTSGAARCYRFRLYLTSVVAAPRELLNAPAVDRLAGIEVALRVEHDAVQESELARLESRRAEPGEDRAHRAVHDVQDLVSSVDLEHEPLHMVVGEREVPRRARGAEPWCAADSQRHAGTRNDRDDPLKHAGLGKDLDAVVGAIAHIHQAVIAYRDATRMAAVARGKQHG